MVYPIPTESVLNIETNLDVKYELRDMSGKLIISGNDKRIELKPYESGVYFLTLIHNERRYNKRIIKQ